jgi:hypothetical protein
MQIIFKNYDKVEENEVLCARSNVFIYGLFNDAASSPDYILSNGKILCNGVYRWICAECASAAI